MYKTLEKNCGINGTSKFNNWKNKKFTYHVTVLGRCAGLQNSILPHRQSEANAIADVTFNKYFQGHQAHQYYSWASLVAQIVKKFCLQCQRPGFDPWVAKIPWKRAWQQVPLCLLGEFSLREEPGGLQSMGLQIVGHEWGTKHSGTPETNARF